MILWICILTWIAKVQVDSLEIDYKNTEAGVMHLGIFSRQSLYQVSYTRHYDTIPKILVALHTFHNCPQSYNHIIDVTIWNYTITNTHFVFGITQYTIKGVDYSAKVSISYLVLESNPYMNRIEIAVDSSTSPISYHPSGIDIQSDSVFARFIRGFQCIDLNSTADQQIFTHVSYYNESTFQVSLANFLIKQANCLDYSVRLSILILISPKLDHPTTIKIMHYSQFLYPQYSQSLNKTFFIGLSITYFKSQQCFRLGFIQDSSAIQAYSNLSSQAYFDAILFNHSSTVTLKRFHIDHNSARQTFQFDLGGFKFDAITIRPTSLLINSQRNSQYANFIYVDLIAPFEEGQNFSVKANLEIVGDIPLTMNISFPVFNIIQIDVNPILSTISILMINIQQTITENNLIFNQSQLQVIQFDPEGGNRYRLKARHSVLQNYTTIEYKRPGEDFGIINHFMVTTISSIHQSAVSKSVDIKITDWAPSSFFNHNVSNWKISNVVSHMCQLITSEAQCTFMYIDQLVPFEISCTRYNNINFVQNLVFTLFQVRVGRVLHEQNIAEIQIGNFEAIDEVLPQDFSIPTGGGPLIQSVERRGDKAVIIVDISNYVDQSQFQIVFAPPQSATRIVYEKIKLIKGLFKQTIVNREEGKILKFILHNVESLSPGSPLKVSIDLPELTISNVEITKDEIIVTCTFEADVPIKNVLLSYDTDQADTNTFYEHQVEFKIELKNPLIICADSDQLLSRNKLINIISLGLSALYLLVLILSIFCCSKMYGMELMYMIQMAYYSLAPIDVSCPPFEGLSGLKYSVPLLPLFGNLFKQVELPNNYLSMGINSNFFSNVNVGLTPLFILPLLYLPMIQIGKRSEDMHTKLRCLKYGKSMLFQLPLTILLFNSFNIYSSIVVTIQAFRFSNLPIVLPAILISLLLPCMAFIFYKFEDSFVEFRKEFNSVDRSWLFQKGKSVAIRRAYPLIMMIQFFVVPLVLTIEILFGYSLFIVLGVEICVTALVVIVPLYQMRVQNIRNYVHRGISFGICVIQIMVLLFRQPSSPNSSLVNWLPLGLIFLLVLGLFFTGSFIVYKSVQFILLPKLIDNEHLIKKSPNKKPKHQMTETSQVISKSEFVFKDVEKHEKFCASAQLEIQPEIKYLIPDDKIQLWFDQIGNKNYFDQLGLSKENYVQLTNNRISYIEREWFVRSCLNGIRIDDLLIDFSTDIFTLEHLMDHVGPTVVGKLRERNSKNQSLFKLEDDGI